MRFAERAVTVAAVALAAAALAVSVLHAGPAGPRGSQGPAGPQGQTGRQGDPGRTAQTSRFGVCWTYSTQTGSDGVTTWVTSVDISAPQLVAGVYQCPQGETFVSIVPQPATGGAG
jgi:hypothetical protein